MEPGGDDWQRRDREPGRMYPGSVVGIHLNGAGGAAPPEAQQTPEERECSGLGPWAAAERDYLAEQQHKAQTMSLHWRHPPNRGLDRGEAEELERFDESKPIFTQDQMLTDIMIYLVTDTVGSSFWFYRGLSDDRPTVQGKVTVPTAFASFPRELPMLKLPAAFSSATTIWCNTPKCARGTFPAFEQPALLVQDLRTFFRIFGDSDRRVSVETAG